MNYIVMVCPDAVRRRSQREFQKLNIPFYDADDFHSMENKEKMSKGYPSNDDDRQVGCALHDLLKINKGAAFALFRIKGKNTESTPARD